MRWTEQRNFQAVLQALGNGALRTDQLIFIVLPSIRLLRLMRYLALRASLGILLSYPQTVETEKRVIYLPPTESVSPSQPVLSVIGAGNYARRTLIPAF